MAHNLGRGIAILAGPDLHRATAATLRRTLFCVPGRLVRSARRWHLRLPTDWPWAAAFLTALTRITAIPTRSCPTIHCHFDQGPGEAGRPAGPARSNLSKPGHRNETIEQADGAVDPG